MKFSSKLIDDEQKQVHDVFLEYSSYCDGVGVLLVSDGKMSRILKDMGYDVSTSYVQRARQLLRISPRKTNCSKLNPGQTIKVGSILKDYTISENESIYLFVSDLDMCCILNEHGFAVNVQFVKNIRNTMGIKSKGAPRKFTDEQLKHINTIMREHARATKDSWQLTVSDAEMSRILTDKGYLVNVKYVERIRRSLGIEPLGERGGARQGAGRPSMSSLAQDLDYETLI